MKKVAVLTSGGDAPGMNAAIRAVVRSAISQGMTVTGVMRGYAGLIQGELVELTTESVADIVHRGGTILKSARSERFKTQEGQEKALANLKERGIEGLLVIGGDGSFRGALCLQSRGIAVVGIPATIDNDIACTDYSIGFDTAVNTVIDAINKIRDTATSHERTYVVEVMGRNSGLIALHAGLAGGAESILIPEVPYDPETVCTRILQGYRRGKSHSIVVIAEGVGGDPKAGRTTQESSAFALGNIIKEKTGLETRVTILGHIQRGGNPTALDRIMAARMGARAVALLAAGKTGYMVGEVHGEIREFELEYALTQKKQINLDYLELAHILSSV